MDVLWLWSVTQPCTLPLCNFNKLLLVTGNYCFPGSGPYFFASWQIAVYMTFCLTLYHRLLRKKIYKVILQIIYRFMYEGYVLGILQSSCWRSWTCWGLSFWLLTHITLTCQNTLMQSLHENKTELQTSSCKTSLLRRCLTVLATTVHADETPLD